MQTFHTIKGLRDALARERAQGRRIGLVPTMGNLHDAHLELVGIARRHCDVVVTIEEDIRKLTGAGCDYLFNPADNEMYPNGLANQTRVVCPTMTDVLCGASRPGHFEGVTTVVTKLFNIVQPDEAVFGIKDFQQLAVIRRMAEDLCMPVTITAAPIHREPDGLAMSSRNGYITAAERPRVDILYKTLQWMATSIRDGSQDFSLLEGEGGKRIEAAGFRVDYIAVCNSKTLEPAAVDDTEITILAAMYTSAARLIDNVSLTLEHRG